jgi:hypothetical protein
VPYLLDGKADETAGHYRGAHRRLSKGTAMTNRLFVVTLVIALAVMLPSSAYAAARVRVDMNLLLIGDTNDLFFITCNCCQLCKFRMVRFCTRRPRHGHQSTMGRIGFPWATFWKWRARSLSDAVFIDFDLVYSLHISIYVLYTEL